MRSFSSEEIEVALDRAAVGFKKYSWLQQNVRSADVRSDQLFQKRFNGYYRLRRNALWRSAYYSLMESAKVSDVEFPVALNEIKGRTGRLEASFASKLVATLNPSKPVIDKFVLHQFGLRLPRQAAPNRFLETIRLYEGLCDQYRDLICSPTGAMIRMMFDRRFPAPGITELKKIDLVLWQIDR